MKSLEKTTYVAKVGILSALAALLMLLEIPLFFAPEFYKLDFSDIVALIGGFSLGPVGGVLIELLKNLLKLLIKGTSTAFVGELANFITGCSFILPATLIYRWKGVKTKKHALLGLVAGTLCLTVVGSVFNYYFLLPFFSKLYHLPMDQLVAMGTAVNSHIDSLFKLVLFATAPFNLVKGIICSVVTAVIYPYLSPLLKGKKR